MPQADYSLIYGRQQQPQPFDLGEMIERYERIRTLREQRRAVAEDQRAQTEHRRAQTSKLQRDAQREAEGDAAFDEFLTAYKPGEPLPTATVGKLYRSWGTERTTAVVKGLQDFHTADLTNADKLRTSMRTRIAAIKALPEARRPAAYDVVVQDYVSKNLIKPEEVAPYSPEQLDEYERLLQPPKADYTLGHQRFSGSTNQPLATAAPDPVKPPPVGSLEDYITRFAADRRLDPRKLSAGQLRAAKAQYEAAGRAPSAREQATQDDPALPRGVQDYLLQLRAKHNDFGSASRELSTALRDLRRDHPSLQPIKMQDALRRRYSGQSSGGLDDLISAAIAEEGTGSGGASSAAPASSQQGTAAAGGADRQLEERARQVLEAAGYDASPASIAKFLTNPANRQRLQGGGR